jgi:hypothetical protein
LEVIVAPFAIPVIKLFRRLFGSGLKNRLARKKTAFLHFPFFRMRSISCSAGLIATARLTGVEPDLFFAVVKSDFPSPTDAVSQLNN